jgi:hypothetical protein
MNQCIQLTSKLFVLGFLYCNFTYKIKEVVFQVYTHIHSTDRNF